MKLKRQIRDTFTLGLILLVLAMVVVAFATPVAWLLNLI